MYCIASMVRENSTSIFKTNSLRVFYCTFLCVLNTMVRENSSIIYYVNDKNISLTDEPK